MPVTQQAVKQKVADAAILLLTHALPPGQHWLMELSDYLAEVGMTQTELASRLGCHKSRITRILSGERKPTVQEIVDLEQITGGKVKASDFAEPRDGVV